MSDCKKPVRIAQMMTEMNYGGVEMVVMNYYLHMDHSRYQFDFFALEGSEVPQREEIERLGGRVYIVPKYTHLKSYIHEVTALLKENGYPIVHSQMNALSVFSLYAAKKAGVPIRIAHSHSTAGKGETKKNIVKNLLRPFSKCFPTQLFACSEMAGDWLYGRNAHYEIVNNAIDLSKFTYHPEIRNDVRRELGIEGKFVVGHIGRFCYQKNHDFLIDIFKEIHDKCSNAVLIMAGEGELEPHIREKVAQMGLSDCVKFLGVRRDAPRLYQAMDVFLLPSRYEGLPVVGVEAQAAGLPLITTDLVTKETKILASTRFLNSADSVSLWADAVLDSVKGYERHDTAQEMRQAGFDIEAEAQKLMERYDSMTENLSREG